MSQSATDSAPQQPTAAKQSPLHAVHVEAGAGFTDFGGWCMPLKYGSELAEHTAVREAAGLFDLSHMGEIVVLGPEAADALDAALLSEISALPVGRAKYTLLLASDGGILDDLVVYRTGGDRYLVVANAANRELVAAELRERASAFDCVVDDETDEVALIAIQGPLSREVMIETSRFSGEGDDRTAAGFAEALTALGNYRALPGTFDGHPVLIARTGYTGELGYELFASAEAAIAMWRALLETGAGSGVRPAGLAARDTLRLEAGMPLYGHELTGLTRPAQAGLGRLVPKAKRAMYLGREALESAPAPERVLVGLASAGRRAGRAGYPVTVAGRVVGEVNSGALSPTLGHPIAMAYVDVDVSGVGTELAIDVRGRPLPATVTALPFYQREA